MRVEDVIVRMDSGVLSGRFRHVFGTPLVAQHRVDALP